VDRIEQAARLRSQQVDRAFAQLQKRNGFPNAQMKVSDHDLAHSELILPEAKKRGSTERLEHLMSFLEIRGEAYLELVTDLESHDAYATILNSYLHWIWLHFMGMPIEMLLPVPPGGEPTDLQLKAARIQRRIGYWVGEGYRRWAAIQEDATKKTKPPKRGYRAEIEVWMKRSPETSSQKQAARKLSVSIDVLKSIMSERGRPRYSQETLQRVLKQIGLEQE
jgi:hypothetical protein